MKGLAVVFLFLLLIVAIANAQYIVSPDSMRANKGIYIGSGKITMVKNGTVDIDPPSILAGAMADVSVTVTGLDAASPWIIVVSPQGALSSGLGVAYARVSADDQITVRFDNPTLLAINQGNTTFSYLAVK